MDQYLSPDSRARMLPATSRGGRSHAGLTSHSESEIEAERRARDWSEDTPALEPAAASATTAPAATPTLRVDAVELPLSCFICLGSSEEDEGERKWTHACGCSLVAHHDCLLEWIVEQSRNGTPHCPACNSVYQVKEDRSTFLTVYSAVIRRWDKASMIIAGGGLIGATVLTLTAHGVWSVEQFVGQEVSRAIINRYEKWPLRYYVNYPLIPLTLVLARTPLIDSLLPFIPLTQALASAVPNPLTHPGFNSAQLLDPYGLDNIALQWPPSPTLTLCLLPWLRLGYLALRRRVFATLLGRNTSPADSLVGFLGELGGPTRDALRNGGAAGGQERQQGAFGAEVEVQFNEGDPAHAPQAAAGGEPAAVAAPRPAGENRLIIGLGRFTSLFVGALLAPIFAKGAGAALLWLATRRGGSSPAAQLLQRLLGISGVVAAGGGASWLRSASGMAKGRPPLDPVWVRNLIGGGLLLLARDACELMAGMAQNRIASRREVVSRPFRLSGASTPVSDGGTSSGGVNATGRPAVVHNLL